MTTLLYGGLLVLGLTLLVLTVVRVIFGGIAGPSDRATMERESSPGSARRILDDRYAAGELSTEEYQHRLGVLEGRS